MRIALAGCASTGNATSGSQPGNDEARPESDAGSIERKWLSREPLPSCGSVDLAQGERLEVAAEEELACMVRALAAGEGAELALSRYTIEGGQIREYYRAIPDGALEIFVDSTRDAFSSRQWRVTRCENPAAFPRYPVCDPDERREPR